MASETPKDDQPLSTLTMDETQSLVRRLMEARLRGEDIGQGSGAHAKPAVDADAYRDWRRRTVAELISLPVICPVRRCRRSRRCKGDDMVCLTRHREQAGQRVNLMMGWDLTSLTDDEDDFSW
ncbi:MAG: hypothetical protein HOP09_11720 [Hyphomicrobium sp.]|nr:hypothetical protein [Hyphomicrobium sp.]